MFQQALNQVCATLGTEPLRLDRYNFTTREERERLATDFSTSGRPETLRALKTLFPIQPPLEGVAQAAQAIRVFSVHPLELDFFLSEKTDWWTKTDARRIAKFQLFTKEQICPGEVFVQALGQVLRRSISEVELATKGGLNRLKKEFLDNEPPPTLDDIVDLFPFHAFVSGVHSIQKDGTLRTIMEVRMEVNTGADLLEFQRRVAVMKRQAIQSDRQKRGRQGSLPIAAPGTGESLGIPSPGQVPEGGPRQKKTKP